MSEKNFLVFTGRVWKFGDLINTDLIMPSKAFRLPKNEQHRLCFEAVRPEFAREVKPGDIIVAGENFGMGSSRASAFFKISILAFSVALVAGRIAYSSVAVSSDARSCGVSAACSTLPAVSVSMSCLAASSYSSGRSNMS